MTTYNSSMRTHDGSVRELPLLTAAVVVEGDFLVKDTNGYGRPCTTGAFLPVGFAEETITAGGTSGVDAARVRCGPHTIENITITGTGSAGVLAIADRGMVVYATAAQTFTVVQAFGAIPVGICDITHAQIGGTKGSIIFPGEGAARPVSQQTGTKPSQIIHLGSFLLASIADGNIVTGFKTGFDCEILSFFSLNTKAATTAAKLTTLNLEIAGTNVTGGTLALTSANQTPIGAVVEAAAITAANILGAAVALDVEASSTTAFVEGSIDIYMRVRPL